MKINQSLSLLSLCALLMSGCGLKQNFVPLSEAVIKEVKSTDVYIEECEKKLKSDIESSNISSYTGGGILFALIDVAVVSHRANCAEEALVDLQKQITQFDFQEKFNNRLEQKLRETSWLHINQLQNIKSIDESKHHELLNNTSADSALVAKFRYKLNPQFNVMTGTLLLTLYPTSAKMKKLVNATNAAEVPLINITLQATDLLPHATEEMEENAKVWGQNNGAFLKQSLDKIINQIFLQLEKILSNQKIAYSYRQH